MAKVWVWRVVTSHWDNYKLLSSVTRDYIRRGNAIKRFNKDYQQFPDASIWLSKVAKQGRK